MPTAGPSLEDKKTNRIYLGIFPGLKKHQILKTGCILFGGWLFNPPTKGSQVRFHHLDALRGLAALLVAFHHSLRPFSIPRDGILSLVTSESAVLFFFILSGFVLSGSLAKEGGLGFPSLISYWVKRVFRLYPPALAAMLFALLVSFLYTDLPSGTPVSEWMGRQIHDAKHLVGAREWINTFLLQPNYPYFQFIPLDPPLWTIRVEFACSLALPLLLIVARIVPFATLPITVGLGFYYHHLEASDPMSAYRYLFQFFLGYVVFRFWGMCRMLPAKHASWILVSLLGLLMTCNHLKWGVIPESLIITGMMLLAVPCAPRKLKAFLEAPVLGVWGKISYSFYALHWPVLLTCLSLMLLSFPGLLCLKPSLLPGLLVFVASVSVTFLLALLSQRFVESPFNETGRRLGSLLAGVLPRMFGSRPEVAGK